MFVLELVKNLCKPVAFSWEKGPVGWQSVGAVKPIIFGLNFQFPLYLLDSRLRLSEHTVYELPWFFLSTEESNDHMVSSCWYWRTMSCFINQIRYFQDCVTLPKVLQIVIGQSMITCLLFSGLFVDKCRCHSFCARLRLIPWCSTLWWWPQGRGKVLHLSSLSVWWQIYE